MAVSAVYLLVLAACAQIPVKPSFDEFVRSLDLDRPVIGVQVVSRDQAAPLLRSKGFVLPRRKGVWVVDVDDYSPAKKAGIQVADLLVSVNRSPVPTPEELRSLLREIKVGSPVEVVFLRPEERRKKGAKRASVVWRRGRVKVSPVTLGEFALAGMVRRDDPITAAVAYVHRDTAAAGVTTTVYAAVLGGEDEVAGISLTFKYVGRDWVFWTELHIKAGPKVWKLTVPYRDVKRDVVAADRVWEWYTLGPSDRALQMAYSLATADRALVRFAGDKSYHDHALSRDEQKRLLRTLIAYSALLRRGNPTE